MEPLVLSKKNKPSEKETPLYRVAYAIAMKFIVDMKAKKITCKAQTSN